MLSAMADHSDLVLFYTLFPTDADQELHEVLTNNLKCTELTDRDSLTSRDPQSSDIYARLRHPQMRYPLRLHAVREFLSPHGTHIITVPIAVNLPRYLHADPGHIQRADWLGCHGIRRSLDYNLFSGSVFSHQLLFHPILRGYDYFVKQDLDIQWHKAPVPSLFQSMREQQCVFMHSEYNGYGTDCGEDAPKVYELYASTRFGTSPPSKGTTWWASNDYFYGNLLGGWLGWMHSEENRQLAEFVYEDPTVPGYFPHRWGDQPPYHKMLGMWFHVSDDEVRGQNRTALDRPDRPPVTSKVCDFHELRNVDFTHY